MNKFLKLALLSTFFLFVLVAFTGRSQRIRADAQSGNTVTGNLLVAWDNDKFLPPKELATAKRHFHISVTRFFAGQIYPIVLLMLLIFSGLSKQMYLLTSRASTRYFIRLPLFIILFMLVFMALKMPLQIWDLSVAEKLYGNKWIWSGLFKQMAIEWGLLCVAGIIAAFILSPLLKRKPKTWWMWSTAVVGILYFAFILIIPTMSMSGLKVMPESKLKSKFEVILAKAGTPNIPIYVREVKHSGGIITPNGRVTGIPPKIVLWDFEKTPDDQMEFLFAHELSHYIYKHIYIILPLVLLILGIGLPLSARTIRWIAIKHSNRTGFSESWETPVFPAWLMMILLISFLGLPVAYYPMWLTENQADSNGARLSGKAISGANEYANEIRLYKMYPEPPKYLYVWLDPHPPIGARVRHLRDIARRQEKAPTNRSMDK